MSIDLFVKYDINFYSAFFLMVILITIYMKKDIYSYSSKIFKLIIITNIFLLVFEGLTFFANEFDGRFAWYCNYILNFIVFLITPLVGSFWATYIDFKIYGSKDRIAKRLYYLYPFIIGVVLLVINLFYPVLFSISEQNTYQREPLIFVNVATLYLLLCYVFFLVVKKRNSLEKNVLSGVLFFMLFPAIGGAIQMLFYGVSSLFSMMTLGIVATYIFMETIVTSKDYITNLYTRIKSDEHIKILIDKHVEFAVIMIDLDDFKALNDLHGHTEGDKVLKSFGIVLKNVFDYKSLVSRFGGDEFLIVVESKDEEKISDYKKTIYKELKNESNQNELLNTLKFSYGSSFFREGDHKTLDEIIVEADNQMYLDKAINKNYKRRRSDE